MLLKPEPNRSCNGLHTLIECGRLCVGVPVVSNHGINLVFVAFLPIHKHTSLMRKSNRDLLARNHHSVSEWIDVPARGLLFQLLFHYEKYRYKKNIYYVSHFSSSTDSNLIPSHFQRNLEISITI